MRKITASVEEYSSWLDFVLERQRVTTMKAVMALKSKASLANASGNSRVQIGSLEIANDGLDAAIDIALGQFKRISRAEGLNQSLFREATDASLRSFVAKVQEALMPGTGAMPGTGDLLKKRVPELSLYLERALHWYDVGLLEVTEPQVPISMTNSIHVGGNVIGSAIQQGAEGSSQNTQIATGDITSSLGDLERALSEISIAEAERASLVADIKTIRAQLEKPNPSRTTIVEAGRSIRSVVENIVASAITPQVLAALSTFTRTLGLS